MDALKTLDELQTELSRVRELIAASEHVLEEDGCEPGELRRHLLGLRYAIVSYTDLEDAVLPEVLQGLSAWGADEIERMAGEHRRRRRMLAEALTAVECLSGDASKPAAVRAILRALTLTMSQVLQHEEDELLSGAVAREESIVWDGCDG